MQGNGAIPGLNNGTTFYTPALNGDTFTKLPAIIDDKKLPPSETYSAAPAIIDDKTLPPEARLKTLPAVIGYTPTNEGELVAIDGDLELSILDKIAQATEGDEVDGDNTDKPIDISNPREVTVEVTDEQKETIDSFVDSVVNHFKGDELLDNVMYKDENGNPKSQVITKKNEDGTYSKITITYDENGNVKNAAAIKYIDSKMEHPQDGYEIAFSYNDDGTITAQSNYGWDIGNGIYVNVGVYFKPITIQPDGSY